MRQNDNDFELDVCYRGKRYNQIFRYDEDGMVILDDDCSYRLNEDDVVMLFCKMRDYELDVAPIIMEIHTKYIDICDILDTWVTDFGSVDGSESEYTDIVKFYLIFTCNGSNRIEDVKEYQTPFVSIDFSLECLKECDTESHLYKVVRDIVGDDYYKDYLGSHWFRVYSVDADVIEMFEKIQKIINPKTQEEMKCRVYHYNILLSNNSNYYGKQKSGIPFGGQVVAKSKDEALQIASEIAVKLTHSLFEHINSHEEDFLGEVLYSKVNSFHQTQSLSINEVSVELTKIIDEGETLLDKELVDKFNDAWSLCCYRSRMYSIFRAYYERDCEEIANYYDTECVWWQANEKSFEEMMEIVSFDDFVYMYLGCIADDNDLCTILNYLGC